VSGQLRTRWWLVWFGSAALLIALSFGFDGAVQKWFEEVQTPALRTFMRQVTRWGDWPTHVALGLLGAGIAYARKQHAWLIIFLAMVLSCAVAGSVNRVVKMTAGRSRPSVEVDVGWNGPRLGSKYHAFASGHTAATTAFFGTLLLARRRLGLALLPLPLLIATSRLYLNAHHLSDVVAGGVLGFLCAALTWHLVRSRSGFLLESRSVRA